MVFPVEGEASVRGSGLCNRQRQGKGTCGGGWVDFFFLFLFLLLLLPAAQLLWTNRSRRCNRKDDRNGKFTATHREKQTRGRLRDESRGVATPRYF